MRIYYFSGATFPSSEAKAVHVIKMCEAFGRAGHDVTLFAKGKAHLNAKEIFKTYDVDGHFKFALADNVRIPILSGIKRLQFIPEKMKIMGEPDLIYGRDPVALALFTPPRVPVVYEAHQLLRGKAQNIAMQKLIRLSSFAGIVAVSEVLKQDLLNKYPNLKPEQIFVAHDAADLPPHIDGKAERITALKGRKDAPNVGYAGMLHPGKGLSMILKIAPVLPDYDFHVIGGTPEQLKKIRKKNPPSNVIFYGHRPHAEVLGYLKAFDMVLAPYQHQALIKTGRNISRWISPMKVFEYMAAKRPMIASDLKVLQEVLRHDDNALLISPGDPLAWVEAIKMLHENPKLGERLANKAYEDLRTKFTWDTRVETVLDFVFGERTSIFRAQG